MTTDESALLSAIEANPADDLPRLVCADWLEEHGHPVRAEFIRLQCELAPLETDERRHEARPHHRGLWERQAELVATHRDELLGLLAGLPGRVEVNFKRGFPGRVELRVADFLAYDAILDAARPRPRIRVNQVAADVAAFLRSPHLGCVTEIGGYAPGLEDRLPEWPTREEMEAVRGRLTRLEVLDLEGCGIGDWFAETFTGFDFPALVKLDLANNHITDVGVSDLLNCRLPRELILGGNPITDQGAIEMADRLGSSAVEYLNLRRTHVGLDGYRALLNRYQQGGRKVDLF